MFNNNQPSDKKTFVLQLNNRKVFAIAVAVINKISGWVYHTQVKIKITATALLLVNFVIAIKSKTRITSYLKALYKFVSVGLRVPRVRIIYTFKMRMRVVQSLLVKSPRMIPTFQMRLRILQTVRIPRVRIAYSPVVAQFIILGQHDYSDYPVNTSARTLGNRDTLTLLQMDGTYY